MNNMAKTNIQNFKRYKPYSIRLKYYDYSSSGGYFITICTKNMISYFGKINEKDEIILSEMGRIAEKYWLEIPKHFPNVKLGIHQIMPNHIHGMIEIMSKNDIAVSECRDAKFCVSTGENNDDFQNKFGPQSRNLGSIIRGFKSAVKKYATMNNMKF